MPLGPVLCNFIRYLWNLNFIFKFLGITVTLNIQLVVDATNGNYFKDSNGNKITDAGLGKPPGTCSTNDQYLQVTGLAFGNLADILKDNKKFSCVAATAANFLCASATVPAPAIGTSCLTCLANLAGLKGHKGRKGLTSFTRLALD